MMASCARFLTILLYLQRNHCNATIATQPLQRKYCVQCLILNWFSYQEQHCSNNQHIPTRASTSLTVPEARDPVRDSIQLLESGFNRIQRSESGFAMIGLTDPEKEKSCENLRQKTPMSVNWVKLK
jgi:hypothetical protein